MSMGVVARVAGELASGTALLDGLTGDGVLGLSAMDKVCEMSRCGLVCQGVGEVERQAQSVCLFLRVDNPSRAIKQAIGK